MLVKSRTFISEQTLANSYVYIEIPFSAGKRNLVHLIDHIHSQRLSQIPGIKNYRCETYTGFNTYSIEMQLAKKDVNVLVPQILVQLFDQSIRNDELKQASCTTFLESIKRSTQRKGVYVQLFDYQTLSIRGLEKHYQDLFKVSPTTINQMLVELKQSPKIVIGHVPDKKIFNKTIKSFGLMSKGLPMQTPLEKLFKLPKKIDLAKKERGITFMEIVYREDTINVLDYELETIKYAVYHDVLRDILYQNGLTYGIELYVNETLFGITHMVFCLQALPGSEKQVVDTFNLIFQEPLLKIPSVENIFQDQLEETKQTINSWDSSPLELDFNRAWQEITFGRHRYLAPAKLLNKISTLKIENIFPKVSKKIIETIITS